ncbi:MAG: tetratricopeptide repeat protein [Microcystis aeruginosa Ma_MB_S_20031200_S102]|uniref:Tetratricopeptide repeat protein n=1 Tax=Microcystis aeruginosa Ma_MB_S_20031200_S102 TaxID=2486254 RepID=A0A552EPK1_MICAE|nr:MAG: tetratricopeptide repeat protein [Microcystis aeruginosa Ma_MB_S_20031200_S102D]TRU36393.1 MAG: tetratricopeptide repeat protein [Microcystis aeruginosa Ma_MB_S_20031200_S102]
MLPQLDESTFTGREAEIKQLEEQLFNRSGSHVCSIVGLSGGGGIGKSALACHFATIHRTKFPDGIIGLRVDGKSPAQISRQFVNECLKFSGEKLDLEEEQDAATLMQETFAHRRMLLIFDNAVDASLKQLRPGGNLCSIIITTRNRHLSASLDIPVEGTIDLDPLPEEKAYQLLEIILGVERVKVELEAAYEIIRLVGCLPLALQITGKRLRNTSQSLTDYLASLQQEKTRLSRLKVGGDDDLNVTASLNLSLKELRQEQRDFFACLSVCAEDGFARRTAAAVGDCQDEWNAQDYLQVLHGLSLLNSAQIGENRFVFHPLVRVYARNLAEENNLLAIAQERHAKFFIDWLQSSDLENGEIIPQIAENLDDIILAAQWLQNQNQESLTEQDKKERYEFILKLQPLFEENGYYEKAIKLMKTFQSWAKKSEDWNAVVKYQMHEARYLSFAEKFEEAEKIIKEAATPLKNLKSLSYSKYKERKAKLLNVLGIIFQKQGKIEKAIKAFKSQVFINEEIGNDKSLAIVSIRLGRLLESQHKFEEAEEVFQRGIEVSEAINDQLQLAICLDNLGLLMYKKYPENKENAIKLGIKAAAIYKNLNRERRAAGIYINIGGFYFGKYSLDKTYLSQHLLDKSLTMFLLAAELCQNIDSVDAIIFGLRSLAREFHLKGNFKQALIALKNMIEICLKTDKKKLLAIAYHRLGLIYSFNKQFIKSQQAFEYEIKVALEINDTRQLAIGLRRLNDLYNRFIKENNFVNAENLLKRLIEIFYKYNAKFNVIITLNRLGWLLQQQGKLEEAQQSFERQILIAKEVDNQSQLVITLNRLGLLLQQQGKLEEAQQAFERSIDISRELNNQHQLSITLYHFGLLLKKQGNIERAIVFLEESASLFRDLGENKKTGITYITLGGIYQTKENLHECLRVFSLAAEFHQDLDCSPIIGSLRKLAGVFQKKKEFNNALNATNTLIDICLITDNQKHLSIAYHILGIIQLDNKNFLQAQRAFEKEIAVAENINDLPQIDLGLFRLVELMKSQGKLKSIENLLRKCSEIFENSKTLASLKKIKCILADIKKMDQQWYDAEKLFREAYDLAATLEDERGKAVIANNLGKVIANQEGEEKFQLAQMYFRQSIKLGVKLNDQSHLAKVYTAMGQAFLANGNLEQAINKLSEGFAIDETLANIRGLKIITPDLIYALTEVGRQQEALDYCDRCLKIAHNDSKFLQLKKKIQEAISRRISVKMLKFGVIVFIKQKEKDNLLWGKIAPNDQSPHIHFNERFVGSEIVSKLTKGTVVLVELEEKSGKFYAKRIEVME